MIVSLKWNGIGLNVEKNLSLGLVIVVSISL